MCLVAKNFCLTNHSVLSVRLKGWYGNHPIMANQWKRKYCRKYRETSTAMYNIINRRSGLLMNHMTSDLGGKMAKLYLCNNVKWFLKVMNSKSITFVQGKAVTAIYVCTHIFIVLFIKLLCNVHKGLCKVGMKWSVLIACI